MMLLFSGSHNTKMATGVYTSTLVFIGIFTVFWIMFAVYPLGTNNPGTAVRFRTDFIMIIYVAVIVIMSRSLYINWRGMIPTSNGLKRLIPNNRIPAADT